MSSTEELYELIHTLVPREKRYFKLYAQFSAQKTGNHYTELFDLLNKMPEFNAAKLHKKLTGRPYLPHLHSTVYHLYHLLLKSLKSYQSGRSELSKLREDLGSARILYEKGLFRSCGKLLNRCRKKAQALEAYKLLLEILELEKKLIFKSPPSKFEEGITQKLEQVRDTVRNMENENEFAYLRDLQVSWQQLRRGGRASQEKENNEQLRSHPLLNDVNNANTFRAGLYFHEIQGHFSLLASENEEAFSHFRQNMEQWELHPKLIEQYPESYLHALVNLLNASIFNKNQLIVAQKVVDKIRQIPIQHLAHEVMLLDQAYYAQLIYALNSGYIEGGEALVNSIEALIDECGDQLGRARIINYYYNITNFYFLNAQYESSLHWLNKILNLPKSDVKQHLQDFARIFQIILHFELKNEDLVEYLQRSAYRYYLRKQQLFEFEQILFDFLGKILRIWQPRLQGKLFQDLYKELWGFAKAQSSRPPTGLYELIFWLQSRVEGKSLRAVFQERTEERWKSVEEDRDEKLD